jgi:hypothetical protein
VEIPYVIGSWSSGQQKKNKITLISYKVCYGTTQNLGYLISLKIHFLHSLLTFFPEKLGAVSVNQGEQFDQGKAKMEQRYQERWYPAVMGNYSLFRHTEAETSHARVK